MSEQSTEELERTFEVRTETLVLTGYHTKDKLKLFIEGEPLTHPLEVTQGEILQTISNIKRDLIHDEILRQVVEDLHLGKKIERRRIAKGRAPVEGRDGKLLLLVKKYQSHTKNPEVVDRRFLRLFDNVEKGSIVGRLYPPHEGSPGITVFGDTIAPKPGRAAKAALHPSLTLRSTDRGYEEIIAEETGYLNEESGKLRIQTELILRDDISFATGDIDFIGDVQIQGSVQKDFEVRARGNIRIKGDVLGGSLQSTRGEIVISGNAESSLVETIVAPEHVDSHGAGEAAKHRERLLRSRTSFRAHSVRGYVVEAGGDIELEVEAASCILRTKGAVRMPKGHLLGGEVRAVCGVDAKIIGTRMGGETIITLCSDVESSLEYDEVARKLEEHRSAVELLRLHLGPYADNPARLQFIKNPHRGRLEGARKKMLTILASAEALDKELQKIMRTARYNHVLRVNFREALYRGTKIVVRDKVFCPEKDLFGAGSVEFLPAADDFVVRELQPLECSLPSEKEKTI